MRFTRWDEVFDERNTHETVSELVTWHLSQIKAPSVRERLSGVLVSGDLAICKFDPDYATLDQPGDAYHLRQVLGFFQKRRDLDLGVDRTAVALQKFRESEQKCLETNRIFKNWSSGNFQFFPDVESVFHRAQRIIASILGDVPSLESLKIGFGPGATTQTKRKISSARSKLSQKFCCSEDLVPMLPELLEQMPAWLPDGDHFDISSDSLVEKALVDVDIHPCRLNFVPKNAKTDRGICTEPSLNVMFQRGVGAYMARRLSHFGVDIRDQTLNQRLAQEGSITGALATLDLSMASDLIATECVAHLLPIDWFFFLSRGRSSTMEYKGEIFSLQKFSSMGNGFTFPLETLIFYAIAKACCERDEVVSAYGDDLIVPTHRVDLVIKSLVCAGFVINTDKSYITGPFRESCGADYLLGTDIRPYYLRDKLSGHAAFCLYNFYVRRGWLEPAGIVLTCIDKDLQLWGPDGYGDGHLIDTEWTGDAHKRHHGWCGRIFGTYTFKSLKDFTVYSNDRVLPCYSIYSNEPRDDEPAFQRSHYLDPFGDRPKTFISYRAATAFYQKSKNGVYELGVTIPGYKGYKRVEIYVLT
jgi:hypothetical protein